MWKTYPMETTEYWGDKEDKLRERYTVFSTQYWKTQYSILLICYCSPNGSMDSAKTQTQ